MDLFAAIFYTCEFKAEAVVNCYDRLKDKSSLGKLLQALPQDAQVQYVLRLNPCYALL